MCAPALNTFNDAHRQYADQNDELPKHEGAGKKKYECSVANINI